MRIAPPTGAGGLPIRHYCNKYTAHECNMRFTKCCCLRTAARDCEYTRCKIYTGCGRAASVGPRRRKRKALNGQTDDARQQRTGSMAQRAVLRGSEQQSAGARVSPRDDLLLAARSSQQLGAELYCDHSV